MRMLSACTDIEQILVRPNHYWLRRYMLSTSRRVWVHRMVLSKVFITLPRRNACMHPSSFLQSNHAVYLYHASDAFENASPAIRFLLYSTASSTSSSRIEWTRSSTSSRWPRAVSEWILSERTETTSLTTKSTTSASLCEAESTAAATTIHL